MFESQRKPKPEKREIAAEVEAAKKKEPRPPPIVLREEGKLEIVRLEAEANKIRIDSCRATREGIKLFVSTASEFRRLKKLLEGKSIQHHTYCLKEERPLKVVLRGIPREIGVKDVGEELTDREFLVLSATHIKRLKEDLPLVLVSTEKTDAGKKLFNGEDVVGMKIRTEPKRKPTSSSQCFRCQLFNTAAQRTTGVCDVRVGIRLLSAPTKIGA